MKNLLILFVVMVLTACTATSSVNREYALNPQSQEGLLLTSITYLGRPAAFSVIYQPVGSDKTEKIKLGERDSTFALYYGEDGQAIGRNGEVYALELPAGKYKVVGWMVESMGFTLRPTEGVALEFEIVPGKATYFGRFEFYQLDSVGFAQTQAKVDYTNESWTDLRILSEKLPMVQKENILNQAPKTSQLKLGGDSQASMQLISVSSVSY